MAVRARMEAEEIQGRLTWYVARWILAGIMTLFGNIYRAKGVQPRKYDLEFPWEKERRLAERGPQMSPDEIDARVQELDKAWLEKEKEKEAAQAAAKTES